MPVEDNQVAGFFTGILITICLIILIKLVSGSSSARSIINCMPILGNRLMKPEMKKSSQENLAVLSPDNVFNEVNKLKPQVGEDSPDWAKNYALITNKLLSQDFTKSPSSVQYSKTRSACGWLQLNRDLRRVPIPKRDPSTVSSFYLPSIDTKCYAAQEKQRDKRIGCY